MATFQSAWIPNTEGGQSAALLGPSGVSGVIFLGKNRIFRIWTDNPSGLNITFGLSTGTGAATPTATNYAIGSVPQEFDTGPALDEIQLANISSISSAHYFIQAMNKF
jgi:hypothetical protein